MRTQIPGIVLFLIAALALSACGGSTADGAAGLDYGKHPVPEGPGDPLPGPPPDDGSGETPLPDLVGGVLVTIETVGERWTWWVTNPESAQALYEIWNGEGSLGTYGGPLRGGPGAADHNAPWSWHVDPQQNWVHVIGSLQPDAARTPSDCENRLSHWLSFGGHFAPAEGAIVEFIDRRLSSVPPTPR